MDIDKLNKWADLLLDTGKRNNLINFKDAKMGTVEIVSPDFDTLFSKAEHLATFEVYDPKLDDEEDDEEWEDDEDLTDLFDEENPLYEITCPKCGEVVCMDEDMLFSPDCACPNCGTSFEIEFDEECDCEECAEEDEE